MLYDRFAMQPDIRNVYAMSESIADGVVVRGYAVQKKMSVTGSVVSRSNAVRYASALVSEDAADTMFESELVPMVAGKADEIGKSVV